MKTKLNIIPSTRMIRSWREDSRIKIDMVIKELVDNSFDAFATEVVIAGGSMITVRDDGRGIRDMEKALCYGASEIEHKRLGRFGIALKKGPARLARHLNILTQNKREQISVEVDWLKLERSGDWCSLDVDRKIATSRQTFTEIEMIGLYPYRLMGWKDLPAKLSATFAPALRDGKKILFDGVQLEAPPEPVLDNVIDELHEIVFGGRTFTVRAGLRPEGETGSIGVSLAYLHRVVVDEWTPKFLLRCNLRRFSASVRLIDGDQIELDEDARCWKLNNFKDDLDEEQLAELEAALETILKPLIDRVKDEAHNLRIKTLEKRIAQFIFGDESKDPYLKKDKDGDTVKPPIITKHGRRRKRRKNIFKEQLGTRVDNGGKKAWTYGERSFNVRFEAHEDKRQVIIILPFGNSLALIVNTAHKYGAELEQQFNRNEFEAVIATTLWALGGYMTSKDDYQKRYPYLLNGQDDTFDAMNINVSHWLELGANV